MAKLTFICPICGKAFHVKPSHIGIIFSCSNECGKKRIHRRFIKSLEAKIGKPIKKELYRLYVKERKSYRYICKLWGINTRTLMKIMRECDISPRDRSEAIKTQWEDNDERRKAQAEYFSKVASENIGKEHPRYIGGTKYRLQVGWKNLAKQVRRRNSNKCTRCGMSNRQCIKTFGKSLDVHHIVPLILSNDNSLDNLTSLCAKCHREREDEFIWLL